MSDYLTDEEQLDKLRNWWKENGLAVVIAVVIAVAGVVGWRFYQSETAERIASASDLYADYLSGEDDERATARATLAERYSDSTYYAFVLLREAWEQADEEDIEGALDSLGKALDIVEHPLDDLVRLRIARLRLALDELNEALEVLRGVNGEGYRSLAQEIKGDILLAQGDRARAHEAYASALAEAGPTAQRPLLKMKVADTADSNVD